MNEELEFLKWFYNNCDFGPAHSDILSTLHEYYVKDTGKEIPKGYEMYDYDAE